MIKYPAIYEIHHPKGQVQVKQGLQQSGVRWFAQEVICGAHLSLQWDGEQISLAQRDNPLKNTERYFRCHEIISEENLRWASHQFSEFFGPLKAALFGVIYGSKIRNEVTYTDGQHFRAFDLAIQQQGSAGLVWANPGKLQEFCARVIPRVPILTRGSLSRTLDWPLNFKSSMALDTSPQPWSQGAVFKTMNMPRSIFWRQNPEFPEQQPVLRAELDGKLPPVLRKILQGILPMITDHRMRNILVKHGRREQTLTYWRQCYVSSLLSDYADLGTTERREIQKLAVADGAKLQRKLTALSKVVVDSEVKYGLARGRE